MEVTNGLLNVYITLLKSKLPLLIHSVIPNQILNSDFALKCILLYLRYGVPLEQNFAGQPSAFNQS